MDISSALRTVLDPAAPDGDKRSAQAALDAFKATDHGLQWAINALDTGGTSLDQPSFWLAADILLHAARARAAQPEAQELLRARLWAWLRRGSGDGAAAAPQPLPYFAQAKLAAALACTACLAPAAAYPQFWPELQQCLAEQQGVGLQVLTALLEEFHSLAQATSVGFRGKVLSSQIPGIQARYCELQPAALGLLGGLLRSSASSAAPAVAAGRLEPLAGALEALRALRKALAADVSRGHVQQQQQSGSGLVLLLELLLDFAQVLDLEASSRGQGEAAALCQQLAALSMDCAGDILLKGLPQPEAGQALQLSVAKLPGVLASLQRHWERGGMRFPPDGGNQPALAAAARLLSHFVTSQLGRAEASPPELLQAAVALLGQATGMMFARRHPVDVLALGEVWHAVLDHLSSLEAEAGWDEEAPQPGAAPYKAALLQVAQLVLATLFSPDAPSSKPSLGPPPFSAAQLDGAEGSGAAMEDWLQAVSASGNAGEGEELEAEAAAREGEEEEEEEQGEVLAPGPRRDLGPQAQSEQAVYTRLAEAFVSRVATSFSSEMLPLILGCLAQQGAAFAGACRQLAAAQQAQQAAAAEAAIATAARDLDVPLRLVARSGASLPLRGLGEQAGLADLAQAAASGDGPVVVTGGHAASAYSMLLDLASRWLQTLEAAAAARAAGTGGSDALLAALAPLGARIYRTLGALSATWLSRLMLTQLTNSGGGGSEAAVLVRQLAHAALAQPAQLLAAAAGALAGAPLRGAAAPASAAAAESLVPLTSIALSSSMKPPQELLQGLVESQAYQALQAAASQSLPSGGVLPTSALRALWLSLSDLSLRSWSYLGTSAFPGEACRARFATSAANPLAGAFSELARGVEASAAAGGGGGVLGGAWGGAGAAAGGVSIGAAARRCAAVVDGVALSYAGTPKHVRGIVYTMLIAPLLPPLLSLLRHAASRRQPGTAGAAGAALGSRAGTALLRLLGFVIEVFGAEIGTQGLEQLLGGLVDAFGTGGGDPSMESDIALMQLLVSVLGQGGNKHQALLAPSLQFCLGVWQRAGASREADIGHLRAAALASLLSLLRHHWRQLSGSSVQLLAHAAGTAGAAPRAGAGSAAAAASGPLVQLHQQLQQQAAGSGAAAGEASGGAAAIAQVVALLGEYVGWAASGAVVLAAGDVRLVLEELFELQVVSKLYQSPHFQPAREAVLGGLLCMLLSRCYTAAQNDLVDTLFSIAAANWSDFFLSFLPRFVDGRLGWLGPSERGALLGLFGSGDLDAPTFERQALAFMNDVLYYEAQAVGK